MGVVDPEGLERRGNIGKKKRRRGATGTFTSLGPNHTYSADGHDKLMGFMKDTFPLAIYGMQDVYSGYILYLKVWASNSNPKLIGRWYLEHFYDTKVISNHLRLDRGTDTSDIATIHAFLIDDADPCSNGRDSVHYGPSTNNKIERWWRELHHRMEKFFKRQLMMLLEQGYYDPDSQADRDLLSFVFIPVIQKEINIFKDTVWNSHRVRCQKDAQLPKGVPLHLYSFPEEYGADQCGFELTKQSLDEVAQLSGVMNCTGDYLSQVVRQECERVIPELDDVKPQDAATTFIFLKSYYNNAAEN